MLIPLPFQALEVVEDADDNRKAPLIDLFNAAGSQRPDAGHPNFISAYLSVADGQLQRTRSKHLTLPEQASILRNPLN